MKYLLSSTVFDYFNLVLFHGQRTLDVNRGRVKFCVD
jgi:hypothetical protein